MMGILSLKRLMIESVKISMYRTSLHKKQIKEQTNNKDHGAIKSISKAWGVHSNWQLGSVGFVWHNHIKNFVVVIYEDGSTCPKNYSKEQTSKEFWCLRTPFYTWETEAQSGWIGHKQRRLLGHLWQSNMESLLTMQVIKCYVKTKVRGFNGNTLQEGSKTPKIPSLDTWIGFHLDTDMSGTPSPGGL